MGPTTEPSPPARYRRPGNIGEVVDMLTKRPKFTASAFTVRPTDIFIATYPKSGTTWTQHIVHGLRTGGSMEFEEISVVVPWIEIAPAAGIDLDADQVATPRAFKTHLDWNLTPRGARSICVIRHPLDTVVSYYHFVNGVMFDLDSVSLEDFALKLFAAPEMILAGGYWPHIRSWWGQRHREDVLLLCYEDMCQDLEGAVRRIARFIDVHVEEEVLKKVVHQSTFEFMREHPTKFDDHPFLETFSRLTGQPATPMWKLRSGNRGKPIQLPFEVRAEMDARWQEEITRPLGFQSYAELREELTTGNRED